MARRLGERSIMASYSSDEITDVEGDVTVTVISKSEWEDKEKEVEEKVEKEENMATETAAADETDGPAADGNGAPVLKPVPTEANAGGDATTGNGEHVENGAA